MNEIKSISECVKRLENALLALNNITVTGRGPCALITSAGTDIELVHMYLAELEKNNPNKCAPMNEPK